MPTKQKYISHLHEHDQVSKGAIPLTFFNLFWIFVIVSVVGLFGETIVSFFRDGAWESRAGLVFGPFSPIYGVGAVLITITLNPLYDKSPIALFVVASIIGATFEYLAGWFFESAFGIVAWSYEGQFLNFHGHTCLLMACIWGLAGLVWMRCALPLVMDILGLIPQDARAAVPITVAAIMFIDIALTIGALDCWYLRTAGAPVETPQQAFFAQFFDDQFMQSRFETMSMWTSLASR